MFRWLWISVTVIALIWVVGLGVFTSAINSYEALPKNVQADAIVVLTGGSHRTYAGIDLLEKGIAKRLFVSGVARDMDKQHFFNRFSVPKKFQKCCVEIGYEATNTKENALEVQRWANKYNIKSVLLVTSHFHMPRSLMEFQRSASELKIIPYAAKPELFKSQEEQKIEIKYFLLVGEYNKLIGACLRTIIVKAMK